jgi:hypothetical protein
LEFKAGWQARQIVLEKNSGGVFSKKMIKGYHGRPVTYQLSFEIELVDGFFANRQNEARSTMKHPSHRDPERNHLLSCMYFMEEKVQWPG